LELTFDFWLTRKNLFGKLPQAASAPAAPGRDVTASQLDAIRKPGQPARFFVVGSKTSHKWLLAGS
jgi:hypothetical protein